VAANYDLVLTEKDRISFAGRYGKTNQGTNVVLPLQTVISEVVGVSATYSRKLNDRMTFTVSPSYTRIFGDTQRSRSNASIMAGVTVRFGKLG
jgi:hypothetical protein